MENRGDIIASLENAGLEVHRRGKDYISVKDPENPDNKPFRLKGRLYTAKYDRPDRGHDTELEVRLEADNLDYSGWRWSELHQVRTDRDRTVDATGIECRDGWGRDIQGEQGQGLYSGTAGKGRSNEIPMRTESLSQNTGVKNYEQQPVGTGTGVNAIRERIGTWFSNCYQKVAGWFEPLTDRTSGAHYETRIAEQELGRAARQLNDTGKDLKCTLEIDRDAIKSKLERCIERKRDRSRGIER